MDTSKNEKIILVNLDSNNSKKVINYLNKTNQNYYSSNDVEVSRGIIKQKLNQGYKEFIICGGDGSINKFINEYQKLSLNKRKSINLGIIPCGRANDLARALNLPLNTEKAFDIIQNRKTKQIDIIKVNNSVFITGGGLGLPAEIIVDVNKLSKNFFTRIIKKLLGDSVYLWVTLKKFIFRYEGIEDEKNKLLAVYILNQSFIGKNFNLAPEAKNNDGYFDAKFVKIPPTFLSKFKTLSKGSKGEIDKLNWVSREKVKKLKIILKEPSYFMGDGELFEKGNEFKIEVIPHAINIFVN